MEGRATRMNGVKEGESDEKVEVKMKERVTRMK